MCVRTHIYVCMLMYTYTCTHTHLFMALGEFNQCKNVNWCVYMFVRSCVNAFRLFNVGLHLCVKMFSFIWSND